MTALEIDQELVRRPSVNPIHDPASTGEAEVVDWQALRTRDDWRGRVTVGCVVDEENEYRGILKLIEDQAPWDYAVVGEPTDLRVVRGCKGSVRLYVRVRGRAAYSSDPSQGRNAIVGMAPVLEAMKAFFDEEIGRYTCPGFTPATGSVGVIEGGSAPNIVPDECAVTLDIRTVPGQDNQGTLTDLEDGIAAYTDLTLKLLH